MEKEAKASKFPPKNLPKQRLKRETSPEESNLRRKQKTASLSTLYPPPRPPLSIVYCLCFASGKYCNGCCCSNCQNNSENEEARQAALGLILQRNQKTFRTMIISSPERSPNDKDGGKDALILVKHISCCCKRSYCIQGYCECYQANIFCSQSCKCKGCKNLKTREETSSKEFKDQENFLDSNKEDQLNCTLAQNWLIFRRAAPGPLNFRFRSLLADIIQPQNLTEFCELLIVTSKAVRALSEKINPLNLESLSHEETVKNSAVQIENKDKGPEDQGPKPENHLSAIQVDMICKDSTCDAITQKERPTSPETLALMCDEKDMLFRPDASSDLVLNCCCYSDVYVEQEKVVLVKLRDFLNSLITSGKVKESELSARAKRANGRENVIHNFVF